MSAGRARGARAGSDGTPTKASRKRSPPAPASTGAPSTLTRSAGTRSTGTPLEQAKALTLRVLAFHARSERQLRDRLARAGHDDVADEVVAWARRLGYLDDAAYARGRATALLARVGPRLAERRLRAEGIDEQRARAAVAAASEARVDERVPDRRPGEPAEVALCRAAVRRRLRDVDPAGLDDRERSRLVRFLLGRGFSGRAVAAVLGWDGDLEG